MMVAAAFQRVLVEIMRAVARQAAQSAVIKGELHDVGITAVAIEVEHPLRPEDEGDRSAGLGIGRGVRQVVVRREAFVRGGRPEPRRHVHALRRHIRPEPLACGLQRPVSRLGSEIGHRRIEVHCAHGMPEHFILLTDGLVRLAVFVGLEVVVCRVVASRPRLDIEVVRLRAALVDEIGGEVEVLVLTRDAVKLRPARARSPDARNSLASGPLRCRTSSRCGRRSGS